MDSIAITVNDKPHSIPRDSSVQDLISLLNLKPKGIAIAVNSEVIRRSDWGSVKVNSKDSVIIITATQGG